MKRIVLALLLTLALLLSGCAPKQEADSASDVPIASVDGETEATDSEVTVSAEEAFDLSNVAVAGAEGFYELSLLPQIAELDIADMVLLDENTVLLLTGEQQDTLLTLNLEAGAIETLCQLSWSETINNDDTSDWTEGWSWCSRYLISADPIIIISAGEEEQCFLVREDGTTQELPVSYEEGAPDYYSGVYTQDALYWYDSGKYGLQRLDLDTLETAQVGTVPVDYLYIWLEGVTPEGEAVLIADTAGGETVTLVMSVETGELTAVYDDSCYEALVQRWMVYADAVENSMSDFALTVYAGTQQAEGVLSISLLSQYPETVAAEDYVGWLCPALQGRVSGRSLFLMEWADGTHTPVLWDYGADSLTDGETEELTPLQWEPYSDATERAAQLSEQYGVYIYTGEAVLDAPITDYTLSVCDDAYSIDAALDALEEAFSRYPENYLEQLGGNSVRAICFYLSGTMTPVDTSLNISNPAGLSCQAGDLEIIALDAGNYIRAQDVIHELTHVLDHQLWLALDEDTWNSMNPEGFEYHYAYIGEDGVSYEWGDTTYTADGSAYYNGDVESVYFVDAYSTTYPTEDRARLMEYLLADPDSGPNRWFASSHVQEKLTYYFALIRAEFDTTDWPEQTVWEAELAEAAG
ncbi:MAG: hypothetical protein LIO45_02585 [Clostridiales bacterium]|nr:hypothetical protein [Clostridiales bacterium]